MPGGGGSPRLAKLVGASKAKEMMFFGAPVDVNEAYRIGLVNRVVEVGSVLDEAMAMAHRLCALAPRALEMIKTSVELGCMMDQAASMEWEGRCFSTLFGTEDAQEGMRAFLEKRKPVFTGR
jgi:enoyl-CoA hydratase